ncbi:AAA family ATPase [Helicobacter sp. MIT 99-5507]|uniref:AAA family ATPase n=1 Tax=Helicobacter sp. MIT 99-5507 TaxID=152489 RepID=UPI000E1F1CC3|nr:AAA family ATPase [Helicobacter sp. MIT 99-5507]RDU56748.1 AAA family ATPase [Helicobacter sp. MIT 99-5507]
MQKSKNLVIIIVGLILIVLLGGILFTRDNNILITNDELNNILLTKEIQKVSIDDSYLYIITDSNAYKIAKDLVDLKSLDSIAIEVKKPFMFDRILASLGVFVILLLGFAVLLSAITRTFKKPKPKEAAKETQIQTSNQINIESNFNKVSNIKNIKFDDIAGIKEVKDDLFEIIDYIKNPKKYQDMGIHLPKGILLVGPPGVGKTMIAKAIANEANVPFFYQSGSSFAQIYVGMGAKRVRELFFVAKASAPSIIFIDEIDAVGKARGENRNDERETTLNQLLTEMDGFEDSSGVIVVGATNRIEVLDSALLRAGRFDRRLYIDLPDFDERKKIIELYLKDKEHKVDIDEIARQSVGFSGAAIASLVNEASLNALRKNSKVIENDDFYLSHSKIESGIKKQLSFSEEEKQVLSLYQAAKAISAYWCDIDFDKITLLGDGIKKNDKNILSKSDLTNMIKVALSGSVVLEMNMGESYTNCKDDIRIAKQIAFEMSQDYAMMGRIMADSSDVESELQNIKSELQIFFNSAKGILREVQAILLKNEKITKEELREILKEGIFIE